MLQKAFDKLWQSINRYNQAVEDYVKVAQDTADPGLAFVNWGIDKAEAGELEAAIEKFEQAVAIAPDRPEPLNNLGVALAKLGRIDEAIVYFEKAYQLDHKSAKALTMWGAALLEKGQFDAAQEKYKEAITLSPQNPEPYVNWGIGLARLQKYHEAIKHFQTALALYPYQGEVYFYWGAALAELERYEEAILRFQSAVRFLPEHAQSYYFWAISLNRLKRYKEGALISQKAAELDRENAEIILNWADALANLDLLPEAIDLYRHAISINPKIADAYLSLGMALAKIENPNLEEAKACFKQALELNPELTLTHYHWGLVLAGKKLFTDAVFQFQKAYQHHPHNIDILIQLGIALTHTGQKQEGFKVLQEAAALNSDHPQVCYLLGTQYLVHQQPEQAITQLERALELQPKFVDAAINLAMAYCELGQNDEAVRTIRPMVRENPENAGLLFYYASVLMTIGDLKDARQRFEKALTLAPDLNDATLGLAELDIRENKFEHAEERLTQLTQKAPELKESAIKLQARLYLLWNEQQPSEDLKIKAKHALVLLQELLGPNEEIKAQLEQLG